MKLREEPPSVLLLSLRCFEPVVSKRARRIRIKQMAVPLGFWGERGYTESENKRRIEALHGFVR